MAHTSVQADEFLQLRRNISKDSMLLDKFDEQLPRIIQTDPDGAADILQALSESNSKDDRDLAAIYVEHLYPARQEQAKNILRLLLNDPHDDIRRQAENSLDAAIGKGLIIPIEAARLMGHD